MVTTVSFPPELGLLETDISLSDGGLLMVNVTVTVWGLLEALESVMVIAAL